MRHHTVAGQLRKGHQHPRICAVRPDRTHSRSTQCGFPAYLVWTRGGVLVGHVGVGGQDLPAMDDHLPAGQRLAAKEGRRSPASTPISWSTSAARPALMSRARSAGKIRSSRRYRRGVPGQHDDQRPADTQVDPGFPAARLTPPAGQVDRPGEPRVLQVGVVVLVEAGEVLAAFEQPRLEPPDGGTRGRHRRRFARSARRLYRQAGLSARRPFIRPENSWWQRSVPACRTETAPRGSPPASWDSRRACCEHNRQWPSLTASTRPHPEHCCSPG